MTKKAYIIVSVSFVVLLGLFLGFWFWGRYFFTDEFFTVNIIHDSNGLRIENEEKLTPENIHTATSVMGQWKNNGTAVCDVNIISNSLNKNFSLATEESFGVLLPKGENVKFTFCDQEGAIDLRKL